MKFNTFLSLLASALVFPGCNRGPVEDAKMQPNIILILADDLGYGDLGCFGQKLIETPNLDRLAAEGMLFSQHYSGSPVCAPSRCVLLTGKHTGHAYIRGNDEWKERGDVWDYRAMIADSTLEGQRPLPAGTRTIGSLLQSAGYKTAIFGKWGLGAPHTESIPTRMGFDHFCGYNCQRQAHTYYPTHLYLNEHRLHLHNDTVAPHATLAEGADPFDPASYDRFSLTDYAPEVMFDDMTGFIKENSSRPFFIYWASPIPHVPLQAPDSLVQYYVQKFGDEAPYTGAKGYFPHRYPHAAYAAMVSFLDARVGELISILKEKGIYEETLIIFTSDNGPTFNGGTASPWFNSGGPFRSAKGWAKGFLHEGGIRVPLIASWPGRIHSGTATGHISAFWDLLPTLCDAAGAGIPEDIDGISFLPTLLGEDCQEKHPHLYWEFPAYGGQQAVRMDHWKGIRMNITQGDLELALYNLDQDQAEQQNLAGQYPGIMRQIEQIMELEHTTSELEPFRMEALESD